MRGGEKNYKRKKQISQRLGRNPRPTDLNPNQLVSLSYFKAVVVVSCALLVGC